MSLVITAIDPNTPISTGPGVINTNFANILAEFNSVETFLNPATQTLKMTNLTGSVPTGGMEALTLSLTKASGVAFAMAPGGGATVMSINADGTVTALKIVCTGTGGGDISTFNKVAINDVLNITNTVTTINGILDLRPVNTVVQRKYTTIAAIDNMTTAVGNTPTAAVPLDLHLCQIVLLDASNSGGALSNGGCIQLNTTNMVDGQIIEIYLTVNNSSSAVGFYNGPSVGNEIFAFMDTAGAGITSISSSVMPTFAPGTNPPLSQSYMKLQYINIGGGNYRFLVLEQLNVLNAS